MAGASGTGKTSFLAWLAVQFRDSLPIFTHQPRPLPAQGIIVTDRSWLQSTSLWFEAAEFLDIRAYSLLDDESFDKRRLRRKHERILILEHCLDQLDLPRGSLLWIDPIALFLGGNLLDYDACLVACSEIRAICQERWLTVIGTAHTAKLKADVKARYLRPQDRILGTAAQLAYTDTQMYLASPEEMDEAEHYTFLWNPHHAPSETFFLARDEAGLLRPAPERPKPAPALVEEEVPPNIVDLPLAQQILDLLPTTAAMPYAILQERIPEVSRATLYRVLQALEQGSYIRRPVRGQYQRVEVQ